MMTEWVLKVDGIGDIKFKTGRAGFGELAYEPEKPEVKTEYYCPVHKKHKLIGKRMLYCSIGNKYYTPQEAIKVVKGRVKPRTIKLKVNMIVPLNKLPRVLTSHPIYLIPVDTFKNITNLNEFIKLLLDVNGVAITSKARIKMGAPARHYGIFVDEAQRGLVMIRIMDEAQLRAIPESAKYDPKYIKSAQQIVKAKKILVKRTYED